MSRLQPSTLTFSCWGHPAIRGTHDGTLELTLDRDITRRATCVVGVAAQVEAAELSGYAGPVTISLRAGGQEAVLRATANSGFRLGRRIVVRRSEHRSRDTFATGADQGAAGIQRDLVRALALPDARLLVTIEGARSALGAGARPLAVVALPDGGPDELSPRALAALGSAELVLGGLPARRAIRRAGLSVRVTPCGEAALRRALSALGSGRPVALARSPGPGGEPACERRFLAAVVEAGIPLDPVGFTSEMSVLLASGFEVRGPVVLGRLGGGGEVASGELDRLAGGAVAVWRLPARALSGVLAEVERRFGEVAACCALDAGRPVETAVRGTAGSVRRVADRAGRARGDALLVIAADGRDPGGAPPGRVEDLMEALAREGVPDHALARALMAAWGWRRRAAHAAARSGAQGARGT